MYITGTTQHVRADFHSGCSFYKPVNSSFIWRFPIAFQIVPLIFLLCVVYLMPESPRWLIKVGREEEGRYILGRLRGEHDGLAEAEFQDIRNIVELERKTSKQNSYLAMLFGWKSGKLHTGRRVQLVIWLQILQEWIGIAGITIYGPTIFRIAGISPSQRLWVSGLNDITYMVSSRQFSPILPRRLVAQEAQLMNPDGHPHLRLHPRPHWPPLDPLLGLCRPRHLHVRRRRSRPRHHQQSRPRRRRKRSRRRSNFLRLPLHCYFRSYVAYRALALPG